MIRTNSVELTTLPASIAYRRKSPAGGSSIVIIRDGYEQPGIATISKTSGEPIIAANTQKDVYPQEAFEEAIALTSGMPYRKQGKPAAPVASKEIEEEPEEAEVVIDTDEYMKLLDAYTDKNGALSYELMNKEMIQLAHRSDVVGRMVAEGAAEDEILLYVVGARFRDITGNGDLTDEQVLKMADLIDDVYPKGAFKELRAKIRSMKGEAKRL